MDVYLNRIYHASFPNFIPKFGEKRLLRLTGITVTPGRFPVIEPVYTPLLTFFRSGGMILIELAWTKTILLVALYSRWPFIHIERPKEDE